MAEARDVFLGACGGSVACCRRQMVDFGAGSRAEMVCFWAQGAASQRAAALGRAGTDLGLRAGVFKCRGMVVELEKGPTSGRRVVSGRRARRMWLLRISWLCCAACARRQPAGS